MGQNRFDLSYYIIFSYLFIYLFIYLFQTLPIKSVCLMTMLTVGVVFRNCNTNRPNLPLIFIPFDTLIFLRDLPEDKTSS